jgi:putative tryptophan/tyrosine transport system substrate-binding protein
MSAQADKILKGAVLGDLPVEVVTRRELVFNLKTAREVGIVIPPGPLKRAERIIE